MTAIAAAPLQPPPATRRDVPVVIDIHELTKRYAVRGSFIDAIRPHERAQAYALQGVSCDIGEGEFFGLLGPNGAGKTTLLRIMATLILPDEGSVSISGHDVVRDAAVVRRQVALVLSDERGLYWRLSAYENLRLFATLHDLHGPEMRSRIAEVMQLVGLTDTGRKLVGAFSSGMRQRLLIARGLLTRPRVLLLDEPTRSLDPVAARDFRAFLRDDVVRGAGCTIVLATHSADEAFGLCTRIGMLDRGRLLAHGTMEELAAYVERDRYRVWTRTQHDVLWRSLESCGLLDHSAVVGNDPAGWTELELSIPGGMPASARVLSALTASGVTIARFEQVPVALADVIESVISHRGAAGNA